MVTLNPIKYYKSHTSSLNDTKAGVAPKVEIKEKSGTKTEVTMTASGSPETEKSDIPANATMAKDASPASAGNVRMLNPSASDAKPADKSADQKDDKKDAKQDGKSADAKEGKKDSRSDTDLDGKPNGVKKG